MTPAPLSKPNSDLFKDFLEYAGEQQGAYEDDEHLAGLTAFDREQERIKMQKLAELAKM